MPLSSYIPAIVAEFRCERWQRARRPGMPNGQGEDGEKLSHWAIAMVLIFMFGKNPSFDRSLKENLSENRGLFQYLLKYPPVN